MVELTKKLARALALRIDPDLARLEGELRGLREGKDGPALIDLLRTSNEAWRREQIRRNVAENKLEAARETIAEQDKKLLAIDADAERCTLRQWDLLLPVQRARKWAALWHEMARRWRAAARESERGRSELERVIAQVVDELEYPTAEWAEVAMSSARILKRAIRQGDATDDGGARGDVAEQQKSENR